MKDTISTKCIAREKRQKLKKMFRSERRDGGVPARGSRGLQKVQNSSTRDDSQLPSKALSLMRERVQCIEDLLRASFSEPQVCLLPPCKRFHEPLSVGARGLELLIALRKLAR